MAQYMLSVFHDPGVHAAGAYATEEEMQEAFAKVDAFNQMLMDSAAFVFAGGLNPPESARRAHPDGTLADGPAGPGPYLGGFWVVTADTDAAAAELAAQAAAACGQTVEVRALQG